VQGVTGAEPAVHQWLVRWCVFSRNSQLLNEARLRVLQEREDYMKVIMADWYISLLT